jgi:hypothetical protein
VRRTGGVISDTARSMGGMLKITKDKKGDRGRRRGRGGDDDYDDYDKRIGIARKLSVG